MANAHLRIKVSTTGASAAARSLDAVKKTSLGIAAAMTALTAAGALFTRSMIKTASTMEQYNIRLRVLLGSMKEGNRMFSEMLEFARQVPFEFQEIMGAATQLAGVMNGGVDEITKWMPMITDLAAVTGLGLQQTTTQFIRMFSAGAAAADLFRERGIIAMLGFKAGVKYTAEETRQMLMRAWNDPLSKFRGATEQLKDSWQGILSMMGDEWTKFKQNVADTYIFSFFKNLAKAALAAFRDINNNTHIIKGIGLAFKVVIEYIGNSWIDLVKAVQKAWNILTFGFKTVTTTIGFIWEQMILNMKKTWSKFLWEVNDAVKDSILGKAITEKIHGAAVSSMGSFLEAQVESTDKGTLKERIAGLRSTFTENNAEIDKMNMKLKDFVISLFDVQPASEGAKEAIKSAFGEESKSQVEQITNSVRKMVDSWADDMVDAFMNGKEGWKDFFNNIMNDLARMYIKMTIVKPLFQSLFGTQDNPSGLFGSIVSAISPRAMGGPVTAGSPYLVGERGPELFVPGASGNIVPNDKMGGGAVNVTVINNAGAEVAITEQRSSNGTKEIQIAVDKAVKRGLQAGRYDRELSSNFGVKRSGR